MEELHLTEHQRKAIDNFQSFRKRNKIVFSLIIISAVILVWRGLWGIADALILPENLFLSYIVSIVLGFAILLALGEGISRIA